MMLGSLLVLSTSSFALDLNHLQNKLKTQNAGWSAGNTKISASLRPLSMQPMRVADDQVMEHLGESAVPVTAAADQHLLPAKWDWRNVNGKNFVAPVGDQGDCGSCVAFAMLGTLETQLNIERHTPYSPWKLSRQLVFSCGGGQCSRGWLLSEAVNYLTSNGAPDAACMEYQSGRTGRDVPCSLACNDATRRSVRISGYERITKGITDIDKIKAALLKGPVLTSMILFEDFFYYENGVYRHKEGHNRGSHSVMLIGWDDSQQAWIGRNSMGTDWGQGGDFFIAYDDRSLIGRYTYQFQLHADQGFLAIENLSPNATVQGQHRITVHSAFPKTDRVAIFAVADQSDLFTTDPTYRQAEVEVIGMPDRARWVGLSTPGPKAVDTVDVHSAIDSSKLEDGRYYFYAVAYHADGHAFTHPIPVEVKNAQVSLRP
jgi:C1A family cysteine protease